MLKKPILMLGFVMCNITATSNAWCVEMRTKPGTPEAAFQKATSIPDTPSGRRLQGWLQAIRSGNVATLQAFIEANYEPQDLARRPARDRARMEMSFLQGFGERYPVQVVESTPWEITIVGEAALFEDWKKLTLKVSPSAPHHIVALMSMPAEPPVDLQRSLRKHSLPLTREVERYASKLAKADRFSGVVLIAKQEKILLKQGYGHSNKGKPLPNQMETRFGIASMGKMFTAVAIAQLVEAGKLRYEDTIAQVLPDYPNRDIAGKVTIHHLLSHTAGLGDFFDELGRAKPGTVLQRPRDYFPLFADDPLQFEPGQGWSYSNAGFIVLGAIIEQISGQEYETYIRRHIFEPAAMKQTGYATGSAVAALAVGYSKMQSDEWKPGPSDGAGGPAGGGFSTAGDLLRFAQALFGHRLINAKSLNILTTSKASADFAPGAKYGYGFMLLGDDSGHSFGHGGGFPGVCTQLDIFPQSGLVSIVLSNYDPPGGNKIAERIREIVAAQP